MSNKTVQDAVKKSLGYVSETSINMLAELQFMHDETHPNQWADRLTHVASIFNVKMPS